MNRLLASIIGICAFASIAPAATVSFTSGGGFARFTVADSTDPLVGGVLHIGHYQNDPVGLGLNSMDLRDLFQPFASLPNPSTATGFFGIQDFTAPTLGSSAGKRMYVIATDSSNVQDATQIAVFTNNALSNWVFQAQDNPPPAAKNISMDEILNGAVGSQILAGVETPGTFPLMSMVNVVPEPSTSLLALLGIGGLLRRRR